MRIGIWRQGRFSWPLILLFVYSTVWVLAFDYAWRLINAPFGLLLISGLALWLLGVVIGFAVVIRLGNRS